MAFYISLGITLILAITVHEFAHAITADNLGDPFKKEGTEKLLKEVGQRTGIDFIKVLKALAAARNLSPQKSLGLRAGVIRELVRMLQGAVSGGAAVAGKVSRAVKPAEGLLGGLAAEVTEKVAPYAGAPVRAGILEKLKGE